MRVIAIDTSGPVACWTGIENETIVDPRSEEVGRRHDAVLAQGVHDWLAAHRWSTLDALSLVAGPGGYTGLRVGVAFGVAFATLRGLPVVPLSSYEAVAARVTSGLVWVLLPLRKGMVRGRLVIGGPAPKHRHDAEEIDLEKVTLPPGDEPLVPLGEGYRRNRELFDRLLGNRRANAEGLLDGAEGLALAAINAIRKGRMIPPWDVNIDYGGEFHPTPKKR